MSALSKIICFLRSFLHSGSCKRLAGKGLDKFYVNIYCMIGGDGTYHFKVLVPSVAAGAIIGKGGETIAQLQKDTGARVKMSKSHDFYPGKCSSSVSILYCLSLMH